MTLPYETYGTYWLIKPILYSSPYFAMALIAAIAGITAAYFEFKRRKIFDNKQDLRKHMILMTILMYLFMGTFARIFYFIGPWSWTKYATWSSRLAGIVSFEAGMVFYGGLIGGIIGLYVYTKIWNVNFLKYADAWAPSIGIVLFFARFGCFFSGCCFGYADSDFLPWIVDNGTRLMHPTQLYSSLMGMIVFIAATELKYQQAIKKKFIGYVALWTLMIYAVARFLIETIRFYEHRIYGLSASQFISITIFAICAISLLSIYKKRQKKT